MSRAFVFLLILFCGLGCSVNILETFADKTTAEAQLIEVQKLINDQNYDGAITLILSLPTEVQERRDVRSLMASAYAGRSGLNFLTVIEAFEGASSTVLFPFLMEGFAAGTSAKISDAGLAEDQLLAVSSDAGARTQDENVLMALINFSKIGNILSEYADDDDDGTLDVSFEACADADDPGTNLPDSIVREFGLSLVFSLNSLSALTSNFASGVMGPLSDCDAVEALDDFLNPAPEPLNGICAITDPADFTALHLRGFRSLIKENSVVGLGAQCVGDLSTCNCP